MSVYEKIAILENEVQAQYLDAVLNEQSIPHIIQSYHDLAYNGIFQASKGWGHVAAPQEFREEIISILDSITLEDHKP